MHESNDTCPKESNAIASENAALCAPTGHKLDIFERESGEAASVFMSPRYLCGGALRVYTSCLNESSIGVLRRAFVDRSERVRGLWYAAIRLPLNESGRVHLMLYLDTVDEEQVDPANEIMRTLFNRFDNGAQEGVFVGGRVDRIDNIRSGSKSAMDTTEECVVCTVLCISSPLILVLLVIKSFIDNMD